MATQSKSTNEEVSFADGSVGADLRIRPQVPQICLLMRD